MYLVQSKWPSSNDSNIKILGLIQNVPNLTYDRSEALQCLAMFKSAIILSQRHSSVINSSWVGWQVEQTNGNVIHTLKMTCSSVCSSNIIGIVGPRLSREAHTIAGYAESIGIPVVSYTATDPDLSSRTAYSTFYRTVPTDISAVSSIIQLFKRFNWTTCIIIYQNDAYGYSGMRVINEGFMKNNFKVKEMIKFDITTRTIEGNLKYFLHNSGARIIILWAVPTYTLTILEHALNLDLLGPHFLWILSSSPSLGSFKRESFDKLVGILTVEPVSGRVFDAPINQTLLDAAFSIWREFEPESFPGENNVDQYALFAFDATWLLIQAWQQWRANMTDTEFQSHITYSNSTSCFDRRLIDTSLFLHHITSTRFVGITGTIEYVSNGTDRTKGIYYIARNCQSSSNGIEFVPVLKYSEPGSWQITKAPSTIVWPGGSCIVPSDRAMVSGMTLRIGVILSSPFATAEREIDEHGQSKTKLSGYSLDLIQLLEEKMRFIPNITTTPTNSSYKLFLESVANGQYDMLIGDVTVTAIRRETVLFSTPIFDNSLCIIVKKPDAIDVELFSYLRPFSSGLWIFTLAATLYASVLICIFERQENTRLRDRSILSASAMCFWYSIGTIMGYGVDFQATTASGRLLTISLYLLSLVLVASYTANLASNLTKAKPKYIVNSLDDIKKGKVPSNRVGVLANTAIEDYYLREISRGSRNFFPVTSRKHILEALFNGQIDASFLDRGVGEYITNNIYCNLTLVGDSFNEGVFGIVMPKTWPYVQELDMNILSLRESGQLDNLRKKWFQTRKCNPSDDRPSGMRIESMAGLFLTFGVITALAGLSFIWSKRSLITKYVLKYRTETYTVSQEKDLPRKNSN